MDEILIRQLTRQLKIFNRWLMALTFVFVLGVVIVGILLFKIVTFVNDTRDRIADIQQKADSSLDVQKRFCDSDSSFLTDRLCK